MTVSRVSRRATLLLGSFIASGWLLIGCGSSESATDPAEDEGAGVSFPLRAQNDSELNGASAVLTPLGSERTRIEVEGITRASPFGGGPHRIELIHECDELVGDPVADLGATRNQRGGEVVDLGLAKLVQGKYAVAVWFTAKTERTLIACGDIPDSVENSG